jgi:GTP-binding protein
LLKEERSIVSDMPGTTRDTVDASLKWHKRTFRILDTRGHPAAGRVARAGQVEAVSVVIARRAIEQADVAVLVIDSVEGATDQDATIAGEADKTGCGVIIVANKWDLMKGRGQDFSKEFDDKLRQQVQVPRLRADPAPLRAHRRADAEAARGDRQGGGRAQQARARPAS